MNSTKVVEREKDGLHGYVVFQALAVGVSEPGESSAVHSEFQIETLDVAGIDSVMVRVAEP